MGNRNIAELASAFVLALVPLCFAPPLARAQNAWVVDAAMGSGAHFSDLPAAVAAASDGDLVLVRRGVYSMTTVTKALRLVGEPGAELRSRTSADTLRIASIAAGRTVSLVGFLFSDGTFLNRPTYAIAIEDCAGEVHLQGLALLGGWQTFGIGIARCAAVSMNECALRPGVSVDSSRVVLTQCAVRGGGGYLGPGISTYASTVEIAQCDVEGSNGGGHAPAYWGIRADSGTVIVRGDVVSRIAGGDYAGQYRAPAIADPYWHASVLVLDPTVTLLGVVEGFASQTTRRMPALRASGGALGGPLPLELYSPASNPFLVLGSLPHAPQTLPPWGDLWLDLAFLFVIGNGVQGAGEHTVFPQNVPAHPELIGWTFAYQALSQSGAQLELSNAVAVVLH